MCIPSVPVPGYAVVSVQSGVVLCVNTSVARLNFLSLARRHLESVLREKKLLSCPACDGCVTAGYIITAALVCVAHHGSLAAAGEGSAKLLCAIACPVSGAWRVRHLGTVPMYGVSAPDRPARAPADDHFAHRRRGRRSFHACQRSCSQKRGIAVALLKPGPARRRQPGLEERVPYLIFR